ncbi:glutathione S-transferase C-terminal domain-containing protein [Acidisoma silvae]|uniref:glutathione S-transferase C-terminal domain-containing protein n=1 Tax=Acidisoma silvae TaxID=2802396 RepID=UPI0022224573|nr:glutathione S-transferase C-terminal domain-containing protein [Acidisoma silvae]
MQETASQALLLLEDSLSAIEIAGGGWFAGGKPSIADVAIFPAVALCTEAGFTFETMPAVWRWTERFKRLPNFSVMPGILPVLIITDVGGVQG